MFFSKEDKVDLNSSQVASTLPVDFLYHVSQHPIVLPLSIHQLSVIVCLNGSSLIPTHTHSIEAEDSNWCRLRRRRRNSTGSCKECHVLCIEVIAYRNRSPKVYVLLCNHPKIYHSLPRVHTMLQSWRMRSPKK